MAELAALDDALCERVRSTLAAQRAKLLVVDDDPTGSQVVAGVPLITDWSEEHLAWALAGDGDIAFVLTNSRALDERNAVRVNREVGHCARAVADRLDVRLVGISRGDSTLRGHFPAETLALAAGLTEPDGPPFDAILLCPAFPTAGRETVDGVHWVRDARGHRVPVGETEYAKDPTFGFAESDLRNWVAARGAGPWDRDDVASVTLGDIRDGGVERVTALLAAIDGGRPVVVDAERENDLLVVAAAAAAAEERGRRLLARTGPGYVAARAGRTVPPPLAGPIAEGGRTLIVAGSHTALTSDQLARAASAHDLKVLPLDAALAARGGAAADAALTALAGRAAAELEERDVAIATSRAELRAGDGAAAIALKARIANAVADVTRRVVARHRPGVLIAKGGITSHDLATLALDTRRAVVRGQLFPGQVSVWELVDSSVAPGLPFIVFPGNVGSSTALADALTRIKERS